MSNAALDLFGKVLMTNVRDEAISDWKMIVSGKMKGELAANARRALSSFADDQRKTFVAMLPQVVDTVLHHLLWTLEQESRIRVGVNVGDCDVPNLNEVSDGLAGELPTDQGWIARFSSEN